MKKIFIFLVFGCILLEAQSYKDIQKEFEAYKKQQYNAFDAYKKAQEKAFKEFKKKIKAVWDEPKLSTKKKFVSYSKDLKTRSEVDFKNNKIVIETIAKNEKEAKQKLKTALAKTVTQDTKTAFKTDPLEQTLSKIKKPKIIADAKVDAKPILAPVVFKKPPTKKSVKNFVKQYVTEKNIKTKRSKIPGAYIYKVEVKLPNDTTYKRSKLYLNEVRYYAKKRNLPINLVFAIMHTESSFNPKATSYVPAYGLMQIVPRTAGVDSYFFIYKEKKIPSRYYLYNSKNNIKLGTAYFYLLYYKYLKPIKNPISRLYCAIAAYNTGAGNIAWAFTHRYNVKEAAKIINRLTPAEVYERLIRDLRYDEPKHYLRRVTKRMDIYKKIYG